MAAITGYLERSPREVAEDEGRSRVRLVRAVHGFGRADAEAFDEEADISANAPPLEAKHAKLTKMVWHRKLIEEALASQRITTGIGSGGNWYFFLSPGVPVDVIPWAPAGKATAKPFTKAGLWGWAGKMACPTWDLPAGDTVVGGTCPGAKAGQSVVPDAMRARAERAMSIRVELDNTICSSCYAYTGQYTQLQAQGGEILRKWLVQSLLRDAASRAKLVDILTDSLLAEEFPSTPYKYRGQPLRPVRIHSSGDFFNETYFDVWAAVAKRIWDMGLPIRFWCPTRMWVFPKMRAHMQSRLDELGAAGIDNFIIRPSAYHFNDAAPAPLSRFNSKGSTSIYAGHSTEGKADWQCPVYADIVEGGEATCGAVPNPRSPSGRGCRTCWMHPEEAVNYTAHFG